MEDIKNWESKFQLCEYSDRLLDKLMLLNQQVPKPVDINEVTKAIYYARKYHGSQMRQSGEPYYSHPIEVAYTFAKHMALNIPEFFRTDLIITALLHDTIEDTILTKTMIACIFDNVIARQVMDLTRIKEDRKKISAAEMVEILYREKKYDVAFIKIFDRIHNLQTLQVKSPEKAKKIIEETITHVVALSMQLQIPVIKQQIIELCYYHLGITESPLQDWEIMADDNFQLPKTISKNVLTQIYNQKLQGA